MQNQPTNNEAIQAQQSPLLIIHQITADVAVAASPDGSKVLTNSLVQPTVPFETIKIPLQRSVTSEQIHSKDLFVIACAVLCWRDGKVYTFNRANSHDKLREVFPEIQDEADGHVFLDDKPIYGFVTIGGYFLTRKLAFKVMQKYFSSFTTCAGTPGKLCSEDVRWGAVKDAISIYRLECAAAPFQRSINQILDGGFRPGEQWVVGATK